MSIKTCYKLWLFGGALYLLAAIYPLAVVQRNAQHRSFCIVMGIFFIWIGNSYKKRYEKSLAPVATTEPRD